MKVMLNSVELFAVAVVVFAVHHRAARGQRNLELRSSIKTIRSKFYLQILDETTET
jgi:hypothetical protein